MTKTKTKTQDQDQDKLTAKQRVFVDAYLSNGFNATQAAREAGYAGNDNTLSSVGYENLRKPEIALEVATRLNEHCASANEVLHVLSTQMRGSLTTVIRAAGDPELADKLDEVGADKLLKKCEIIKVTRRTKDGDDIEETRYKFEIHDSQSAAIHVGKHHKLFTDRRELTGAGGGPVQIEVEFVNELPGEA